MFIRIWIAVSVLLLGIIGASAQAPPTVKLCYGMNCTLVTPATPLPITPSGVSSTAYTPLTPMQNALAIMSSTALTVPTGSTYAVVCAEGANVKYSTDGTTTPTASVGMLLLQNSCVALAGSTTISNFRAIQASATATLDVSYFK